ncbi:MAG TPA: 1-deoxy-D-xylulose-5-phosphate reductoisomerase [Chroococcales cyanobacterium]
MRRISLLGATGSIGQQTLDIVSAHPDELKIVAMASGARTLPAFAEQIKRFTPELACVPEEKDAAELKQLLQSQRQSARGTEIVTGSAGLEEIATHPSAEIVVTGVVGFLGLKPTAAAIKKGKTIALANKETLVAAGGAIMPMVRQYGASIVPVDSEHSAIFQALGGLPAEQYKRTLHRIWLTASGGPFRTWSAEQIRNATVDDALKHPNWSMGKKITIDSATLMNKGLEVIEAKWLFDIDPRFIKVVIHPQSILHSAVEFVDGSIVGQFGVPDMRLPIHYALFHPDRVASEKVPRLNLLEIAQMNFSAPDLEKFPCLAIASKVALEDSTLPCVLNAANEVVVEAFLQGHVKFVEIAAQIERVLDRHQAVSKPSLDDILEADRWARETTRESLLAC